MTHHCHHIIIVITRNCTGRPPPPNGKRHRSRLMDRTVRYDKVADLLTLTMIVEVMLHHMSRMECVSTIEACLLLPPGICVYKNTHLYNTLAY